MNIERSNFETLKAEYKVKIFFLRKQIKWYTIILTEEKITFFVETELW